MIQEERLLLDTNAALYLFLGNAMQSGARSAIAAAAMERHLFMSSVSAWELGLLMARGRLKSHLSAIEFFDEMVRRAGCEVCDATAAIFANSSFLPHFDHRDPADCLMVATARALNMTLVTSDRKILAYGAEGHVKVMAC